jgi:hypothetical protein
LVHVAGINMILQNKMEHHASFRIFLHRKPHALSCCFSKINEPRGLADLSPSCIPRSRFSTYSLRSRIRIHVLNGSIALTGRRF